MTAPLRQPIVRALAAEGWQIRHTNGGHLQARHPQASALLHFPASPSDWRNDRNTLAQARRLLRADNTEGAHRT